jgi:ABC-type sugar transport system ATPase subunit
MTARAVLGLKGVSKTFPGVVALEDVSLDVAEGEVHALLGENGAGKSTLMAIAAGAMAANPGTVDIGGSRYCFAKPGPGTWHKRCLPAHLCPPRAYGCRESSLLRP